MTVIVGEAARNAGGDCPYPQSTAFRGVEWTGRLRRYESADTWYPSWDADGHLYSPYTDGEVAGVRAWSSWAPPRVDESGVPGPANPAMPWIPSSPHQPVTTGNATLRGADPFELDIEVLEPFARVTPRFQGQYPGGSLCLDGHWYYATYYLQPMTNEVTGEMTVFELGPTPGFRVSADHGRSWCDTPLDDESPLFAERGRAAGGPPIRFGAPHFVDFGQNMEHSPDGRAYLLGHGSPDPSGIANWCAGDAAYLARTRMRPSPDTINDPEGYEFFGGEQGGVALWSRDFDDIRPMLHWPGHCGVVNVTYNAPLRKYFALLCVGAPNGGGGHYDTWLAEADSMTGPWHKVAYLTEFGSQGYFVCMPSKFIDPSGTVVCLFWSANWSELTGVRSDTYSNPPGSGYGLCVGEFRLMPA